MTDTDVRGFVTRPRLDWRGVDKFRLREGRIIEERVYIHTVILRAARAGRHRDRRCGCNK